MHTFTVPDGSQKRLDAFLSANMQSTSRARLQNIIKEGYVAVNGKPASKAGQGIRQGDTVTCELPPAVPIEASPEVLLCQPSPIPLHVAHSLNAWQRPNNVLGSPDLASARSPFSACRPAIH